jgi:hypothetical protein
MQELPPEADTGGRDLQNLGINFSYFLIANTHIRIAIGIGGFVVFGVTPRLLELIMVGGWGRSPLSLASPVAVVCDRD